MYGLAILKEDNPQCPVLKVRNLCLSPDTAIGLNLLVFRVLDDVFDPLVIDSDSVGSLPRVLEVCGLEEARHWGFFLKRRSEITRERWRRVNVCGKGNIISGSLKAQREASCTAE